MGSGSTGRESGCVVLEMGLWALGRTRSESRSPGEKVRALGGTGSTGNGIMGALGETGNGVMGNWEGLEVLEMTLQGIKRGWECIQKPWGERCGHWEGLGMGLRALGGTGGLLGLLGTPLIGLLATWGLTSIRKTPASRAAAAISLASRALMPIGFSTSTALRARRKRRVSGRCCGFTVPT